MTFLAQKRSARIFGKEIRPKVFVAQPKINLQSFKSTPDSLKQRFKAFGRKPSLGAPVVLLVHCCLVLTRLDL